ncbi:ATP synthase subunit alpha [Dirofilaria immitis]
MRSINRKIKYCPQQTCGLLYFAEMAQLCARKLFIGLTRNTTALRTVTIYMKRPYAKVASPEDYGHYTDPLEGHEESMTRRHLVATLAGDDVSCLVQSKISG